MTPEAWAACLEYARARFAPEDEVLRDARAELRRRGWPEVAVSPEEGRLLQLWCRAVGARHVLEIGTLVGVSAIWMARALPPDGRLVTVERDPEVAEVARGFVRRAGLERVVEVRVGEAPAVLDELAAEAPFDVVFIDANKERYPDYLEWSVAHVRPGGLVLADNAFWEGRVADPAARDPETEAIREYNRRAATDPRLVSAFVPIRDGLAVSLVARR